MSHLPYHINHKCARHTEIIIVVIIIIAMHRLKEKFTKIWGQWPSKLALEILNVGWRVLWNELMFCRAKCQRMSDGDEETAPQPPALVVYRRDAKSSCAWWTTLLEQLHEVVLPVIVIVVGIVCSIASLMTL